MTDKYERQGRQRGKQRGRHISRAGFLSTSDSLACWLELAWSCFTRPRVRYDTAAMTAKAPLSPPPSGPHERARCTRGLRRPQCPPSLFGAPMTRAALPPPYPASCACASPSARCTPPAPRAAAVCQVARAALAYLPDTLDPFADAHTRSGSPPNEPACARTRGKRTAADCVPVHRVGVRPEAPVWALWPVYPQCGPCSPRCLLTH
ncbi:hypothetical protein B0H15DRAFT_525181 [Mycena belliarum]|uniref:Uncharacterized protein n=1 Tax=Mycena belliarum TaxID=1033014 RepID=A0AAD6TUJ9_9AGAR|nr:hypothetical protein B0H15DRAFT_525181 [Mycena belliae]